MFNGPSVTRVLTVHAQYGTTFNRAIIEDYLSEVKACCKRGETDCAVTALSDLIHELRKL